MDELTLINRLNSLEAAWGSLDHWLKFWILLVVIGVSVELVVIVVEYRRELHDFGRGCIHTPEKPSGLLLFFALLGAGLVAIGVAGEFFIHIKAGRIETEMRGITARLVAIADQRASESDERSKELEQENLILQSDLVKLRKEAGARRLTDKQKEEFRKVLEPLPTPIAVGWNPMDSEAGDLGGDFFSALSGAHWQPKRVLWTPNGKYGICIGLTDPSTKDTPEVKLLEKALGAIGMPPTLITFPVGDKTIGAPGAQSHVMYLLIATHPPLKPDK